MPKKRKPVPGPWKPQFFRILLPGFSKRLSIPRPFNKYIMRKDCTMVTIISPLGNLWPVKVHGDDNYLYFGEGWEEFCEAHNLYVGCFLVFSYEDEMVFRVTVFDSSTCMKEYTPMVEGDHRDNKTRGGSTSFDEIKTNETEEPQKDSVEWEGLGMNKTTDSEEQGTPTKMGYYINGSFKVTIKERSLIKPYLHIPRASEKFIGISSIKKVMLRDQKMRLWPTSVYHHRCGKNVHSRFGFGWAKFCSNNGVEEGDVCSFETVPDAENCIIHVSVLKKHTLEKANDSNSCHGDHCSVARKSPNELTTREHESEDGQQIYAP